MEIQYTCGWRQVTQLFADGKHPWARLELKPGETKAASLGTIPKNAEVLVIDPSGPVLVTLKDAPKAKDAKPDKSDARAPRTISRPLIWLDGNGLKFPFGEDKDPATFEVTNPSETETVMVLIVARNKAE